MTTDNEVEEFLEHFGVKGMKWGVRKQRSGSGRRKMSPETKRKLKDGAITAVTIGATVAAIIIADRAQQPRSSLPARQVRTGSTSSQNWLNSNRLSTANRPMAARPMPPGARPMPARTSSTGRAAGGGRIDTSKIQERSMPERLTRPGRSPLARQMADAVAARPTNGSRPASTVPRTPSRPPRGMSAENKAWIANFNAQASQVNRQANAQLRKRDNDLNVPVRLRTYLPEYDKVYDL